MRLKKLEFLKVGRWSQPFEVPLGTGLTLVLGDNEAGKSTTRRALEALFFSPKDVPVAPQTKRSFEIAATLALDGGEESRLHRQGMKWIQPPPPGLLGLLDDKMRGRFHDLFGLSHETLRADEAVLPTSGSLGDLLFSASTGLRANELSRLIKELEEQIADATNTGKHKNGLRQLLKDYGAAKNRLADVPDFQKFDERMRDLGQANADVRAFEQALENIERQQKRLERLIGGLPTLLELDEAAAALDHLAAGRRIPASDQAAKLDEAFLRLQESASDEARRANEVLAAEEAMERLPVASPVLSLAGELEAVEVEANTVAELRRSITDLEARVRDRHRSLADVVQGLGPQPGEHLVETAKSLLCDVPVRTVLGELVERDRNLKRDATARRTQLEATLDRRGAARQDVERLPVLPLDALVEADEAAVRAVAAEKALAASGDDLEDVEQSLAALATDMGLAHLDEEARVTLVPPDLRTAKALESNLTKSAKDLENATAALVRARKDAKKAAADCQKRRAELGEVTTPEQVRKARALRDRKWAELKAVWTPKLAADAQATLAKLGDEFESFLASADAAATHLAKNAEKTGELRTAEEALGGLEGVAAEAEQQEQQARTEHEKHTAEWTRLWSFCRPVPESAGEWLTRHANWKKELTRRTTIARKRTELSKQRDEALAEAHTAGDAAYPALQGISSPVALKRAIESELKRRQAANDEAQEAKGKLAEAETTVTTAEQALQRTESERAAWTADWEQRARDLPSTVVKDPVYVAPWLESLAKLEAALNDLHESESALEHQRTRIAANDATLASLVAKAKALDPSLGIPPQLAPHQAYEVLRTAVSEARSHADDRREAGKRLASAKREKEIATQRRTTAEAALSARWRELGIEGDPTAEGIAAVQQFAAAARQLEAKLLSLRSTLEGAWGKDREAFEREARTVSMVSLETAQGELDAERSISRERLKAARERAAEHKTRLGDMQSPGRASSPGQDPADDAVLNQELRALRDAVLARVEEIQHLTLAKHLLEQARERAKAGSEEIGARASELFRLLTSEAFTGLHIDPDHEDHASLYAVDAGGREKRLDELSTGTIDQLWLALRLTAIERAARDTPFPLLLDDVLVQFDDVRTQAGLRVLAEVAKNVQVILFTHHDHVVDLAHAAIPGQFAKVTLPNVETGPDRVRVLPSNRTRHERPASQAAATDDDEEAEAEDTDKPRRTRGPRADTTRLQELIVEVLRESGEWMGRGAILGRAKQLNGDQDISEDWASAIAALKDTQAVEAEGVKKAAKYRLRGT